MQTKPTTSLSAGRPSARLSGSRSFVTLASLSGDAGRVRRVNFEVPADLHTNLKIYAIKQGKSIKEVILEFIASLPD